jgi:hypothetical protein
MRRMLGRVLIIALVTVVSATSLQAQFVVFDPSNYEEAVLQVLNLVRQYEWMLRQAQRLPIDMAARYHGHSVDWTKHELANLRYAQQLLLALNEGDPTGDAYRQSVDALDTPTDVIARMPVDLGRRLANAYAALETADSVSALAVDQAGRMRVDGTHNEQVAKDMEKDAVSTRDDFVTQTALLNKINAVGVLGLRMQDHADKVLTSVLEQMLVANQRQRDAEAVLMNASIAQWRYGTAYGDGLFRSTAANIDNWRLP